jgi:hypothetical protein
MDKALKKILSWISLLVGIALLTTALPQRATAQDQDDPPGRVARLGYMQGSVSFQPAGESDWVQAVPNRPMTTGDKLWADQSSRAEVELGSAVIRLAANTGFSFLNLDDRTMQIQLTSGLLNISVRRLNRDDIFEVDTPNQAFSVFQPGRYRVEASEDGNYTVVSVREGNGESTGNGQTYTLHAGQRGTFSGTESLNADVVQIGGPDEFDNWASSRDSRHKASRSAQYLSHDVVGYEDLDDYGDWRDDSNYGHVWFPTRVSAGWAPYREGHWDWISPWGWTWVDDASWGYAPYHYGRWVTVGGRWGWVGGPVDVVPVYAPALVVFLGAGGIGFGGNVGWFPLGPREVYVPSYNVSRGYMNRVNISNTTVNNTTITNVYNTTIVNRSTNITNVVYQNRNVAGAITAVPQRAFVNAQPVAKVAVAINIREMASVPVSSRATVAPSRASVLGSRANSAGQVAAPPPAVARRQVIAKAPPPPAPVPFARQQQALAAHPGQPLERNEVQTLRPANTPAAQPSVKLAPPGKPATPNVGRQGNPSGNSPNAERPGQPANTPPANRPGNQPARNEPPSATNPAQPNPRPEPIRPTEPPARNDRPSSAQPNRSAPAPQLQTPPSGERTQQPTPPPEKPPNMDRQGNQPGVSPNAGRSGQPTNKRPANRPGNQPAPNEPPNVTTPAQPNPRPEPTRPTEPPARNDRPPSAQPNRSAPAPQLQTPPPGERTQQSAPPPEKPPNMDRPGNQPGVSPNAGRSGRPANTPPANRPGNQPAPNEPPSATTPAQPNTRPESIRPTEPPARNNRPTSAQPNRSEPAPRPQTPPPGESTQQPAPPPEKAGSAPKQQQRPQPKQLTPEEKKRQDEQRKADEKPQPSQ